MRKWYIATACVIMLAVFSLSGCSSDDQTSEGIKASSEASEEKSSPVEEEVSAEKMKDGYYGYLSDDGTKYSLGINIEDLHDYFTLSVVKPDKSATFIEGKLSENTDGTHNAEVTLDDSETMLGKSFTIKPTKQGVSLSADDSAFNGVVGAYPYLGETWEALEQLSTDDGTDTDLQSDDVSLDSFLGYWQDTFTGNAIIQIEKENDYPYAQISWKDYNYETYYWQLYPDYDEDSKSLIYQDGECYLEGDERNYIYRNGTGKFYIKDDYLYWVDDIDKAGDGYTFGRVRPQDLLEQTYNNGSVSLESDTNIDLTNKDLQENDIFSETDYKVMEQIPEVDFSASAIGISLEEFEQMINWDMVECGEYGKRALFKNYFAPRGINESQCDNITFYQRAGDVETNQKYYRDIVGVKNGKIVIYCGIVSSSEIRDILSYIDTDPLKVQIDYSDYVYFWKGNNCYISMHENTLPGEAENFENTKKYYNTYNVDGIRITYLGDLHYSQWFKYGMPMGVVLGGD